MVCAPVSAKLGSSQIPVGLARTRYHGCSPVAVRSLPARSGHDTNRADLKLGKFVLGSESLLQISVTLCICYAVADAVHRDEFWLCIEIQRENFALCDAVLIDLISLLLHQPLQLEQRPPLDQPAMHPNPILHLAPQLLRVKLLHSCYILSGCNVPRCSCCHTSSSTSICASLALLSAECRFSCSSLLTKEAAVA
jgi:hypothetical protein